MKIQTLKIKRTIAQPPGEVYRMLTRAALLRTWLCDAAQFDARKGGRVYLYWNAGDAVTGTVTAAEPNKKVAFTWQGSGDPGLSKVIVALKGDNASTALTLAHEVGVGKAWKAITEVMEQRWNDRLDNLKSVLETGEDLRLVRRPMLGITGMAQNDAETAAKLGVPVTSGIRIGGTVPGMGAEAAGLHADDVIVAMGKTKVQRFPQLTAALSQQKAGDTIPVAFYRGPQKHVLPMTLSRRPPVPMPATGMELAARAREMFERDDAELAQLFEGVSEEDAGCRPAPDEWSAKDVLAHIIQSERAALDFYMQVVSDSEPWFDDFDNELHARPLGLRRVFPAVPALLDELKRAEAETVAFLESLPPGYIAQKRNYWRLCQAFYFAPTHVHTHAEQIRNAIAAARKM
jgi:uncharacterized protein YndB with AHSA1/START domain